MIKGKGLAVVIRVVVLVFIGVLASCLLGCGSPSTSASTLGLLGTSAASTTSVSQSTTSSDAATSTTATIATTTTQLAVTTSASISSTTTRATTETTAASANTTAAKTTTTIETTTAEEESGGGDTVYITDTGKKFHRAGCSSLSKSKHAISRADAIAQGYTPCKICKP